VARSSHARREFAAVTIRRGRSIDSIVKLDDFIRRLHDLNRCQIRKVSAMPNLISYCTNGRINLIAAIPIRGLTVSQRYYYVGLALLVVLLVIAVVKAYRVWEEIHDVEEPDSPAELLESFEEAHAAGELNDEEYERVRRLLASPAPEGNAASAPAPAREEESPP
jgi:uncharacterized membrane protein